METIVKGFYPKTGGDCTQKGFFLRVPNRGLAGEHTEVDPRPEVAGFDPLRGTSVGDSRPV
jgi:hypothetical protein